MKINPLYFGLLLIVALLFAVYQLGESKAQLREILLIRITLGSCFDLVIDLKERVYHFRVKVFSTIFPDLMQNIFFCPGFFVDTV